MLRRVAQGLFWLWIAAVVGAFGYGVAMFNARPHAPDAARGMVVALPLGVRGGGVVYGTEADKVVLEGLMLAAAVGFAGGMVVLYIRTRQKGDMS